MRPRSLPAPIDFVWFVALATLGTSCRKEADPYTTVGTVLSATSEGSAIADSSSVVTLVARLAKPELVDQRRITFKVSSGTFVNLLGEVVGNTSYSVDADVEGVARAYWRSDRIPRVVHWSAITADTTFRIDNSFTTNPAYPDHIILSTPVAETDSVATVSATLFKNSGYFSRGLPLTFRAWQNQGGTQVAVGNFASSPVQSTTASNSYSIDLNLSGPGILPSPDTVMVGVSSDTLQSDNTVLLFLMN